MMYRFVLQPVQEESLFRQVSEGLERLTEARSREKMPGAWKVIDWLNGSRKNRAPISAGRRNFRRGLALADWLLGIFALVPALIAPGELMPVLIAGATAFGVGTGMLWVLLPRTMGVLSLLISLPLVAGSLGNPESLGNLLGFGILLLLLGLAVLVSRKMRRESPYDRAAREIVCHARDFLQDIDSFWFLPEGIGATREADTPPDSDAGEADTSPDQDARKTEVPPESLLSYDKVERAVETEDCWILVIDQKALLLQKKELTEEPETFPGFLRERGVRVESL